MLVIAYLLGSIPSGVWIGKLFYHKDIRNFGSGNSGTTNTYRVLGKKAGTVVLLMDILKGTLAASLPLFFHSDVNALAIGLGAIIGHTYPIFAQFKGGKAVATSAGALLAYNPQFFVFCAILFVSLIYITRMVSLASIIAMLIVAPTSWYYHDPILTIIACILMVFIIYRHRANITRIIDGTENKVPFGLGYKKEKTNK
ncbi:glycerol-3-phosphate 1-O-acyltransferase PlsY [Carnobacterium gallinarum]|uniref:glycerol-3-phosphate 1-O-acyltransferase PlsY n=1 Tax=Carnobacterium gallinarum TaxID=2749 RepID=UPI001B80A848|nr:glycerol-3-phosphate 1-O-acyltransferase PlsY [Carnobacterium gallinarum]